MGMSNDDIRAFQVKVNNNIFTNDDAKKLIHELNLTRNLILDMRKAMCYLLDTVDIIFAKERK